MVLLPQYTFCVGQAADGYRKELAVSPQQHTTRIKECRQLLMLLEQNIVLLRQMVNETQRRVEQARRIADPQYATRAESLNRPSKRC